MSSADIFDPSRDYRLDPAFHENFDVVDLTAVDLAARKAWPVILDEALRLLRPGGTLTFRASNTRLVSFFELMRRVWIWNGGRVELVEQRVEEDGVHEASLRLTHDTPRDATLASMDFVVITDGAEPARLDRFIASAREAASAGGIDYKILVCSSSQIDTGLLAQYGDDCETLITQERFPGWITRRKNLAAAHCRSENVLIVHDRYWLAPGFLEHVKQYGPDYSVLICRQIEPDGTRFPDLVATADDAVTTSAGLLEYDDWSPNVYMNGGAILAKRAVLTACPWNELLLWGQFEDVEWTRRLRDHGFEPRFSRLPTLVTTVPRDGYVEGFEPIPQDAARYIAPGRSLEGRNQFVPLARWLTSISLAGADPGQVALRTGVALDGAWSVGPDGARLPANRHGLIFFRPTTSVRRGALRLVVTGPEEPGLWTVGRQPLRTRRLPGRRVIVVVPPKLVRNDGAVRLTVVSPVDMSVRRIRIVHETGIPGGRARSRARKLWSRISRVWGGKEDGLSH